MKTSVLVVVAPFVIVGLSLFGIQQVEPTQGIVSSLDNELTGLLAKNGFTGQIEEQLEARLGRKLDPKKVELGRLIFFDKGLAWHQDNSCAGCHSPMVGFGDTQFMAIGIGNNDIVGPHRKGPRNQRRSPMVINTGFYPALMWNGRFFSNTNDPFNNSKGFTFPAPEADTFFKANDANIDHLLVAQAHIPFTELPEMAGFRSSPDYFNMSRFQGFLLKNPSPNAPKKLDPTKALFTNKKARPAVGKKAENADCEVYDVSIFSDDTGFPLPPFENSFGNFPIRRKIIELINRMPEYRKLFAEIYPQVKTTGIELFMIGQVIAEFELSLTFAKAPIDRYAMGQQDALTEQQKRGAILFFKKGNCVSCHSVSGSSNEMFSDFKMHNVGIPQLTPKFGIKTGNVGFATLDKTLCANGIYDLGLFEFDGLEESKFKFRTSPLRNVSLQPFFFHNGAFDDLRKAVVYHLNPKENSKNYNPHTNGIPAHVTYYPEAMKHILPGLGKALVNGIKLTNNEIDDLVAFLSVGLLDPQAQAEHLMKLIPTKLPSGASVATFEPSPKKLATTPRAGRLSQQPGVEAVGDETGFWARAYPNPFVEQVTLEYYLPEGGQVSHMLVDAKGRIIEQSSTITKQLPGWHQLQVKSGHLQTGHYYYRLQIGDKTYTIRVVKTD